MFTGIIGAQGSVREIVHTPDTDLTRLVIEAPDLIDDLPPGGSLAVNGVCLTSVGDEPGRFVAELMGETCLRTSLGQLRVGDLVNLERCVQVNDRLDGHVVQGHVDAIGTVQMIDARGAWTRMRIALPAPLAGQVAEKGAIAVDGVSLTVTAVSDPDSTEHWFEVGLIPATLAHTTLGSVQVGSAVNLETDVLAKYTQRILACAGGAQQR